eukprot:6182146-Pleurochrysis_carterae.AAC.1
MEYSMPNNPSDARTAGLNFNNTRRGGRRSCKQNAQQHGATTDSEGLQVPGIGSERQGLPGEGVRGSQAETCTTKGSTD